MILRDPIAWDSVYFEAEVRFPPMGSSAYPNDLDLIPLAEVEATDGGVLFLLGLEGPNYVRVHRFDTLDGASLVYAAPITVTVTDEWFRVAFAIEPVDETDAHVTAWVNDTMVLGLDMSYGHIVSPAIFDRVDGLGQPVTFGTVPRELYVDDVCFAESRAARTGFCPDQKLDRDVVGPDAGPDGGPFDGGPDGARPDAMPDGAVRDGSGRDTSPGRAPQVFRGVGGCDCSPSGPPPAPSPWGFASCLSLLALLRRR
jgi:hypothetical protein